MFPSIENYACINDVNINYCAVHILLRNKKVIEYDIVIFKH